MISVCIIFPFRFSGYILCIGCCQVSLRGKGASFVIRKASILCGQSLNPFAASRLTNGKPHGILTPDISGIGLLHLSLAHLGQSLTIELENLFRTDGAIDPIGKGRLARDGDAREAKAGLSLGVLDDGELCHGWVPVVMDGV